MKKSIITVVLFFISVQLFSQKNSFTPTVKIIFNGVTNVPAVLIKVKTRTVKTEKGITKSDRWVYSKSSYSLADGSFSLELNAHTNTQYNFVNYSVEFFKTGFATKKILFNTYIPQNDYNRHPFEKYDFYMDITMPANNDSTFVGKVTWDTEKRKLFFSKEVEVVELKPTADAEVLKSDPTTLNHSQTPAHTSPAKTYCVSGNFYVNDENTALENARVNLLNNNGKVIQTTTTNFLGSYAFTNLKNGEDYTLFIDSLPPKITIKKIIMTNKEGKKIGESSNGDFFKYKLLAPDENALSPLFIEDGKLLADVKGKLFSNMEKKTPLANARIFLENGGKSIVGSAVTDKNGSFQFSNLASDKNYTLRLDEKDPLLNHKEVFLADENGGMVKKLESKDGTFFNYDFLPVEENRLSTIYADDPWLKVEKSQGNETEVTTIVEKIYYDFGKWEILPDAMHVLNKPIEVMKKNPRISIELISHTDSKGSKEFNMKLSQKRASAAVEYIISKGIDKSRISGKGMGEEKLVNRCKDNVDCSEEEHAQNRRTEFIIKNNSK